MKKSINTRYIIRSAVICLLALTLPMACTTTTHNDKSTAAAAPSSLAKDLIGTWVHVGTPGHVGEAPATGGRLKFRTGRHWTLTYADPNTGLVTEHFGGTYTLHGDEYVETQEYSDTTWIKDNGKSFKFKVMVEGDTMTQFGIDNPWTEVWKRVK
jgi:hypothetical protein